MSDATYFHDEPQGAEPAREVPALHRCMVCDRHTDELDFDFEAWLHASCVNMAWAQFWAAGLAIDIASADGVAVLL